jgi:hypothetical protein
MSSNNNLRDQFPGIAKTDNALSTFWDIAQAVLILFFLAWGLSGIYRVLTLRRSYLWSVEGIGFGALITILTIILFVLGLIASITIFPQKWFVDQVLVNIVVVYFTMWVVGVAVMPLAWIFNWIVGDSGK